MILKIRWSNSHAQKHFPIYAPALLKSDLKACIRKRK